MGFFSYVREHIIYTLGLVLVIIMLLLLHLRKVWVPKLKKFIRRKLRSRGGYDYDRLSYTDDLLDDEENEDSFRDDVNSGLSSETFNVWQENVVGGNDDRKGLDPEAKTRIVALMNEDGSSFDQARLKYLKMKMGENGINPNGLPSDSRLVTFDKLNLV